MGLANLMRPEPFKCKKGDSEHLLQFFKQYRAKMERFFTPAQAAPWRHTRHTGDLAERDTEGPILYTSCPASRRTP